MSNDKILPSERISNEIKQLFAANDRDETPDNMTNMTNDFLSNLIKKSTIKVLQEALEEEVKDYLGRGYYERKPENEFKGYRNGYEPRKIKTAEGKLEIQLPQLRQTEEPYKSEIMSQIPVISPELERIAIETYVRGLSTRDIEDTFKSIDGSKMLSKDAVSKITELLNTEYIKFSQRDLSQYDVIYVYVDGVYEAIGNSGVIHEAILCAWAILSDKRKIMLHLALGNKESYQCCRDFFDDMLKRGLREPLLVVSDGAAGIKKAIDECFPHSRRQRCLVHKLRNIANKLSEKGMEELMPVIRTVFHQTDKKMALQIASSIIDEFINEYPSAIKCFQEDLENCLNFMDFPAGHHRHIKTTNLLERCFEEQRRRTKVIPRFMTEKSCMKLTFGTLIRVSEKWKRIKMSELDLARLRNIRQLMGWKDTGDGFISRKIVA